MASRRGILSTAGGLLTLAASAQGARAVEKVAVGSVSFWGMHQAGIATPQQTHTYFMAFDLIANKQADVSDLLRVWTDAAAHLTSGLPAPPSFTMKTLPAQPGYDAPDADNPVTQPPGIDSNEAEGLSPARLTITFGFGSGLFVKDGVDRYGLAARRPEALIDLPRFNGDQLLVPAATGGDLSVQACADDPQVAFHAVRQLASRAYGVADVRGAQSGFVSKPANGDTPRNLMGFKDGTQQPAALDKFVWVGAEGPAWMRGGSYLVARRVRVALEHWDRTNVGFQEQTMGRHKNSGAPLRLKNEKGSIAVGSE